MTTEDLHRTVVEGFKRADDRLAANDQRSESVDRRLARIDERFDRVDAEFGKVREEMHEIQVHLEARIREEGETTRRYFHVMVEKVEAAVRIVAEGHTHLQTVVDDHEARLQAVDKRT